jgi:hypothetical protein
VRVVAPHLHILCLDGVYYQGADVPISRILPAITGGNVADIVSATSWHVRRYLRKLGEADGASLRKIQIHSPASLATSTKLSREEITFPKLPRGSRYTTKAKVAALDLVVADPGGE